MSADVFIIFQFSISLYAVGSCVFKPSCILHVFSCVLYLSPGPSGPWCGWHRSRCRAWSGQRNKGTNPQEKTAASVNRESVREKQRQCYTQRAREWCYTKPNEYRERGWKSANMWSHDRSTLSSLSRKTIKTPPLSSPFSPNLLSTLAFSSSLSNQWTATSINRPHTLSCQAYKSADDAPVTPPQLFINVKISKIIPFFRIVAKITWFENNVCILILMESTHFGHLINKVLCFCVCISPWTVRGSRECWSQARRRSSPPGSVGRPSGSPTSLAGCRTDCPSEEERGSEGWWDNG